MSCSVFWFWAAQRGFNEEGEEEEGVGDW